MDVHRLPGDSLSPFGDVAATKNTHSSLGCGVPMLNAIQKATVVAALIIPGLALVACLSGTVISGLDEVTHPQSAACINKP